MTRFKLQAGGWRLCGLGVQSMDGAINAKLWTWDFRCFWHFNWRYSRCRAIKYPLARGEEIQRVHCSVQLTISGKG